MRDLAVRLVWICASVVIVSYAVFLFLGSAIYAQAVDETRIVEIRDVLAPGVHNLSGIVMVPRTCAQLNVEPMQISTTTHQLVFTTWDVPSVPCKEEDVPRSFRTIVFAPAAGIQYIATLDDQPLTIVVYQDIQQP